MDVSDLINDVLKKIEAGNDWLNSYVWGGATITLILGVGIILTILLKGIQFRKFPCAMTSCFNALRQGISARGTVTPFQAVCTALAATVGTGNIAGVAGAIAIGGPGATFWMWISALIGMCTKFTEVTLAVSFRERNACGDWIGGPMYYIKNGLDRRYIWFAYIYSALGVLAVFGIGNMTQTNTIVTALSSAMENCGLFNAISMTQFKVFLGVAFSVIVVSVLLGGIQRLGRMMEKLVPFMAVLYVLLGLGSIIFNISEIPHAFCMIFQGAFQPSAVTGGVVGSVFLSIQKGISRGIFSNEAGLGTSSIAHASSYETNAVKQGLFGIVEVFVDTIIICSITSLVVLCNKVPIQFGQSAGAELPIAGFVATYGSWITIVTAIVLSCFAFSTILGWGLYGARCAEFLFGSKIIKPFMVVYSLMCLFGATMNLGLIWGITDTVNGLMVVPNLIALALLIPTVIKLVKQNDI